MLAWNAVRRRPGGNLRLRREAGLVRVHDGERDIFIPHVSGAARLHGGIGVRLDLAAAKYFGGTGYVPREGDVILDVGAGIGEFTLWCAEAGARVLAFEPDPLAFQCLERNTAALPNVRLFAYALWKERANLHLHGSADTSESSLIEDGSYARLFDVAAWPLDAVPSINALPVIDFLKVDGEGVEPEILAGGIRTLRRTRVIAVDIGAAAKRPNLSAKVEAILASLNFRPVAHEREDTILALNTAMVGPFSSRVGSRQGS